MRYDRPASGFVKHIPRDEILSRGIPAAQHGLTCVCHYKPMQTFPRKWTALLISMFSSMCIQAAWGANQFIAYVGTYTSAKSQGIYAFRFDNSAGKLSPMGLAAQTRNPSFLAIHPNGRFLYAVNETDDYQGRKGGSVSAFAIDHHNAKLTLLNTVSSGGAGPCHLRVDQTGQYVLVANYGGGSVATFPVQANGALGDSSAFVQHSGSSIDPKRQTGPHAHMIELSPDNRFALVPDLGLDKVLIYRFRPEGGSLSANDPSFAKLEPGAGPRHLAFHPNGRFAYVISEMQSTITAFSYDATKGALQSLQSISTLPKDFKGESSTAEIEVHPSGKFLYGSNRGHDSIAVFAIDAGKGTLKLVQHAPTQGRTPRNFAIDPTGRWLLAENQASNSIVVFRIDETSGQLSPAGDPVEAFSPVCIKFADLK